MHRRMHAALLACAYMLEVAEKCHTCGMPSWLTILGACVPLPALFHCDEPEICVDLQIAHRHVHAEQAKASLSHPSQSPTTKMPTRLAIDPAHSYKTRTAAQTPPAPGGPKRIMMLRGMLSTGVGQGFDGPLVYVCAARRKTLLSL